MKTRIVVLSAVLWASASLAVDAQTDATPAPPTGARKTQASPEAEQGGITIFGDKETPVGLFLTPWKNVASTSGLDRPARLLEEVAVPIDRATFHRQFDYFNAINEYHDFNKQMSGAH